MSHSLALNGSRAQLISQLVYLKDDKAHFLDQYCPAYGPERNRIDQALNAYTATIEKILSDFHDKALSSYVLIGSEVRLKFDEDGFEEAYTIVFPHQADAGASQISFLSPMGSQLLLKKQGDRCRLQVPSGELQVTIEQIKYMNRGDMNEQQYA